MNETNIVVAVKPLHPEQEKDIDNRFIHHAPVVDQGNRYNAIRSMLGTVAKDLVRMTPKSREQSLALTHLEEAMFWANASIARNEDKEN